MGEERLNSLAVLNIHRVICNIVTEKDADKLVNKFSEGQGRRMYSSKCINKCYYRYYLHSFISLTQTGNQTLRRAEDEKNTCK